MAKIATEIGPVSNGALATLEMGLPYVASVTVVGVADILYHRWNVEGVASKASAKKGSAQKKSDDLESYVYRDDDGFLCIPGEYLRQAVIQAARYRPDPRSPRKSAMDLYKAAVVSLTSLAPITHYGETAHARTWEFEDRRRVMIQRNGVTRTRPASKTGWSLSSEFFISLPEYVSPTDLNDMLASAGRLIGIGDFRPSYGRFQVTNFSVLAG